MRKIIIFTFFVLIYCQNSIGMANANETMPVNNTLDIRDEWEGNIPEVYFYPANTEIPFEYPGSSNIPELRSSYNELFVILFIWLIFMLRFISRRS